MATRTPASGPAAACGPEACGRQRLGPAQASSAAGAAAAMGRTGGEIPSRWTGPPARTIGPSTGR